MARELEAPLSPHLSDFAGICHQGERWIVVIIVCISRKYMESMERGKSRDISSIPLYPAIRNVVS